ncbi:MAG: hypothetical protein ACE5RJ_04945 [Nitrosopumilaceae archaeon]
MEPFSNFSQEKYDKLKIFLISNFSLTFQPSQDPSIVESFEITTKQGKIAGHYHKNSSLELIPSEQSLEEYNKIVDKIREMPNPEKQEQQLEKTNTDFAAQEMMLKEYANNSKKFYEHILSCESCRKKLAEIWKHLYE